VPAREARIDHDHGCLAFYTPVVEHAEVDRPGFRLVVTDIDIGIGLTDILFGIDVGHYPATLDQVQGKAAAEAAIGFGGGHVGGAPEACKQRDYAYDIEHTGA